MLLPNSTTEGAALVAERAVEAVANAKLSHEKGLSGYVTVSAGVCVMAPSVSGVSEDLVKNADKALYEAKNSGRNKVKTFNG
ncbi:hypothetical protein FACS189490_13090 [Clostridia bacterium]|nr:hypothetical protein FACS189490_13090 [Clostridia bacterium]